MLYTQPIAEIIKKRYSCRDYLDRPVDPETQRRVIDGHAARTGPLGTPARFVLLAATANDSAALRNLGTYGFIRGATGFIAGAVNRGDHALEDYGYLLEQIILSATAAGLGTCWLGGTFARSGFAREIALAPTEKMPAVVAVGHANKVPRRRVLDLVLPARSKTAGKPRRLAWESLFFENDFARPLIPAHAAEYALPLEMVRLAPSASNKQPWRVIKDGRRWHFYLQRTPGYREQAVSRWLQIDDLQRVDMGIAMCHFELSAREQGLAGQWQLAEPAVSAPGGLIEYSITWVAE